MGVLMLRGIRFSHPSSGRERLNHSASGRPHNPYTLNPKPEAPEPDLAERRTLTCLTFLYFRVLNCFSSGFGGIEKLKP